MKTLRNILYLIWLSASVYSCAPMKKLKQVFRFSSDSTIVDKSKSSLETKEVSGLLQIDSLGQKITIRFDTSKVFNPSPFFIQIIGNPDSSGDNGLFVRTNVQPESFTLERNKRVSVKQDINKQEKKTEDKDITSHVKKKESEIIKHKERSGAAMVIWIVVAVVVIYVLYRNRGKLIKFIGPLI